MSFSLSNISGSQIQKDSFVNSLTVACDPGLVAPKTNSLTGLPNSLNLEKRDGKAAIGVDICDLDVSNLTVHGNLVAPRIIGPTEICDIVCPQDFSVTAGIDILQKATRSVQLTGGSRGVNLKFNATSSTDRLGITSLNVSTPNSSAIAQAVTANSVTGTIRLLFNTNIAANTPAGQETVVTLTNNKITLESTVLYTINAAGTSGNTNLNINGKGTVNGQYVFTIANNSTVNFTSSSVNRIVISFLVINPAL